MIDGGSCFCDQERRVDRGPGRCVRRHHESVERIVSLNSITAVDVTWRFKGVGGCDVTPFLGGKGTAHFG
jgi:hypothetical protein